MDFGVVCSLAESEPQFTATKSLKIRFVKRTLEEFRTGLSFVAYSGIVTIISINLNSKSYCNRKFIGISKNN